MSEQNFTIEGGFFDSIDGDRTYSADEMNRPYKRIVTDGVFATQFGTPSTDFQVDAMGGMEIKVRKGEGMVGGKWVESVADVSIVIPASTSIAPRKDSVILQVDNRDAYRVARIVYRTGTPSSNPVSPAINTIDGVIELRIATILVGVSVTEITQADIYDKRGSEDCGWITGLITQVDTSELYNQWNSAYLLYYQRETARFNAFMEQLTEQLEVTTNIIFYESHFESVVETDTIPINIPTYDKDTDVLMVFVNRLRATPLIDYNISADGTSIVLTNTIKAQNNVNFLVMKSLVDGDMETVAEELQAINTELSKLSADTDWIELTLKNGASAYNNDLKPRVRKKGDIVFLEGAFKGVTTSGTVIATLPINLRPTQVRYWVVSTSATGVSISLRLGTDGELSIASITGTLASASRVSIESSFIV